MLWFTPSRPPNLRNVDELPWETIDPDVERASLYGVPGDPGLYTLRVRMRPSSADGRPHWHPADEFGTVLSGTLLVAAGELTDKAHAKALTVGAFIGIPATVRHAVWPRGEVVLQIHALGPRVTNYE